MASDDRLAPGGLDTAAPQAARHAARFGSRMAPER